MREIKFRAWDTKKKLLLPVESMAFTYGGWNNWIALATKQHSTYGLSKPDDEWELMQFTGLHDKNGKEIYEGDILKCERDYWETSRNLIVEWHSDCWSLLKKDDPVDSEVMNHNSSFNVPEYQREVIGNIYENPELAGKEICEK